ncbi:MAG: acetolactate synthase small subunit [Lachnospiraceae bacterium]|jgi:acetolactate synthase-1/3 small subunit|nr:acetolactate synthase small subunit [Lachnospiraceae bacterium]MBP1584264.1 acetolactate synthase small subunit [Lachnospiraceae bacterium]MBR3574563.1 acetolactate synthase small subunit [Lachnospiraceae bacterium]
MQRVVLSLLADNNSGVLSRICGLFSRRGYNIESVTAGVTADPKYSRITIVTCGDEEVIEQIEKQVAKLEDVKAVKKLVPDASVYRELCLIKVRAVPSDRENVVALSGIFRGNIIDVGPDSLIIEVIGTQSKNDAFIGLLDGYEILELARTGIAGLSRGSEDVTYLP